MTPADGGMEELAAAYEGLESEHAFEDPAALESYRASMLERSHAQAEFLARRVEAPTRALEAGCGNGRLLVELARRGLLAEGLGIDVALSRIAFAQRWADDLGLHTLRFEAADVLAAPLDADAYGLTACITGAFAYFEPAVAGSAERLAQQLHDATEPGGLLCLELYPHPGYLPLLEAAGGEVRLWKELPEPDPWRFYLSRLALDDSGLVLSHEKTFVHRTSGEIDSGRRERLQLYSEQALSELLEGAGFEAVEFFEGWTDEPYAGGEVMVVTATRPRPDPT